jgi:processive 1,2-diacylglycerol beta-glucosyltransferase
MARILILHATGGGEGHRSAAQALARAFYLYGIEHVWVEDALEHGASLYRQLYTSFYLELSENAPSIWEYVYELADNPETRFFNDVWIFLDRIGVTELDHLVKRCEPDAIICTHFLPLHLIARYQRKKKFQSLLYAVVTDYTARAYWVYNEVDRYFVATTHTSKMLADRGAPPSRITVTGIPIDPSISKPKDPFSLRQRMRIEREPVVTIIGSGLQTERVKRMVLGLIDKGMQGTLIVAAGRNKELQSALITIPETPMLSIHILGFIDYVDDLVAVSDMVVTKAGGLIVSEILARGTPMVLVDPIRGQEEWNADYVVSAGAGVQMRLTDMAPEVIIRLLHDPEWLALIRNHARVAGKPDAAASVVTRVMSDILTSIKLERSVHTLKRSVHT